MRLFLIGLVAAVSGLMSAAPAQAEWWEARTDHFVVYSESSQADAREFATKLERFDMALRSVQNIKPKAVSSDADRLTVFRFGGISDIGRLAGFQGVAGFYIPRIGGSVSFTPVRSETRSGSVIRRDSRTELDPVSVLLHEYTHHFMFQHFSAAYPSWYVEGFAETYATIDLKPDGSFHVGNPPQYRADALLSGVLSSSAERMLTINHKPDGLSQINHYHLGWLLNHYLSFDPSRKGQLTNYLRLYNASGDSGQAARQAFGDLRQLDRDLLRYRSSGRLGGIDVVPPDYRPPSVQMRRLTADEEAIISVKMKSKRGVSRKTAPGVANEARAVAARYPRSFPVQLALAEAEFDARNFAAAERAADAALAIQPDSVLALLQKGEIYLQQGKKDKTQLPVARSWFTKAYEADPQHPASLLGNYMSYYYEGGAIPQSALVGLERAFEMAPYDHGLRWILGRQLLAEKKGRLARSVLLPEATNAHESKSAKLMREVVDLIDAGKDVEAHAKLAAEIARVEAEAEKG